MSDVIRLNEVHKQLLNEYYDLLVKRYGSDCPLLPSSTDISGIIRCALRDAISYNDLLLHDNT